MALKHVYYHVRNKAPVYVRYRIQDAWGWCTGMTQRDDMGGKWEGVQDWELMYTSGGFMSLYFDYLKKKKKKKEGDHSFGATAGIHCGLLR